MPKQQENNSTLVFSYLTLRKGIGLLGLALPFVLSFGAFVVFQQALQSSISYYYWTGMRDVFVGTLFAIGFFLLSYQGYEKADNIAGNLACLFAVGVALFPTIRRTASPVCCGPQHRALHRGGVLGTLIYFCLVPSPRQKAGARPGKS
jgi:hypothetical protein